jgi:phage terminase small subunit
MALTDKQESFVQWLIQGKSQREAYKLAGYKTDSMADSVIDVKASELLKNGKVMVRYEELRTRLVKEAEDECIITAKEVLRRWKEIAFADPNEIIHFRRVCCRYCFGDDHAYQWKDEEEYWNAVQFARSAAKEDEQPNIPSNEGGYGYDDTLRPHPKCPKCKGEGHGEIHATDTRDLSPQGRALYAGVKQTKDGFEIKMQDQGKALENIARHLGMFTDNTNVNLKGGLNNTTQDLTQLSPEERRARIDELNRRRGNGAAGAS